MPCHFTFDARDESDTDRFGAALAHVLPSGAVVALIGTLGAGKTRLVQAVARAVGIDPRDVVSPTFVLVHEYDVRRQASGVRGQDSHSPLTTHHSPDHQTPDHQTTRSQIGRGGQPSPPAKLYHLDAYRIKDDDEFRELGPEEYFESNGWTFVEWADRVADCLPREHLQIAIEVTGPTGRRLAVTSQGDRFKAAIEALRTALGLC
jgi:tRNA threonylcarbamoyladenosine biosynthesis protein TsaE